MEPDPSLAEVGEHGALQEVCRALGEAGGSLPGGLGIGDDAALLPAPPAGCRIVATVDALVEGVHFDRAWAPARLVGRKALAVSLSDVAAMGGVPTFALLAIGAPPGLHLSWLRDLARGFGDRAREAGVRTVGGNLARGPCVCVTATVLGEVEQGRAVTRAGGRPGDALFVTGVLGASALGLALLRGEGPSPPSPVREALVAAHLDPRPRLAEGLFAARHHARAMIDLSDGLAADLARLCEASGCGAEIEAALVPRPHGADALAAALAGEPARMALVGGEDYELCCAVPAERADEFEAAARALGHDFRRVGRLTGDGRITVIWEDGGRGPMPARAFEHFR